MNQTNNPNLTQYAKRLRSEMTKEERRLWYDFLKQLPQTVNRQKVIGPYIVDFYCAAAKLVIELDGSQHYEDEGIAGDRNRDAWLTAQGFTVVRYTNTDIQKNFSGVCEDILRLLDTSSVCPSGSQLTLRASFACKHAPGMFAETAKVLKGKP